MPELGSPTPYSCTGAVREVHIAKRPLGRHRVMRCNDQRVEGDEGGVAQSDLRRCDRGARKWPVKHRVLCRGVGNVPEPQNGPSQRQPQSSVQDCSRAQKVVFVQDLTLCGARGTGL